MEYLTAFNEQNSLKSTFVNWYILNSLILIITIINMDIAQIRKEYALKSLDIQDVHADPFIQFQNWLTEAINAQIPEPTAMHLATVSTSGQPSGRIVLLKGVQEGKFIFFTNYESQKGKEMAQNPLISLTFFWAELERQIRIDGKIAFLSEEESTTYFHSRPRLSQIGAVASAQSTEIESREWLEKKFEELTLAFEGKEIPKPEHWGGYAVMPHKIEFWQGRRSRLHDRIVYELENEAWRIYRLAP